MSLLPRKAGEFGRKDFWDKFFNTRNDSFEWYGEYNELCGVLHSYVRTSDSILVAGCGNSNLSLDLYKIGYRSLVNADVSDVVIKQMKMKHPEMNWVCDDLTKSQFSSDCYSCVLDKGTLDAIFTDDSTSVKTTVEKYLSEISRVLRVGGRYICVSLLQEHILKGLIDWAAQNSWMVRLCRCEEAEEATIAKGQFAMPVFVVICTKFKPLPSMLPMLDHCLDGSAVRCSAEELAERVESLQEYSSFKQSVKESLKEEVRLEMCNIDKETRYTLFIIDATKNFAANLPFAIFIVPQSREVEWQFGSPEGRIKLLESCSAKRLVVVHLQRDQKYQNGLKTVQDELNDTVKGLSPSNMPQGFKPPFLAVGSDVGSAKVVHRGKSSFCGDYVVEDVVGEEDALFRRLVFLTSPGVVQSEVRLNKKNNLNLVDHSWLSCQHHLAMVTGLGLVKKGAQVLVLGLGGGPLAGYISNNFPKMTVDAVELDPEIVKVAKNWFDFKPGNRLKVIVQDAIEFCQNCVLKGKMYDAILLDVDSKDLSEGLSCPPKSFIEEDFLKTLRGCLQSEGVLMMNVVCRGPQIWQQCVTRIQKYFGDLLCQPIPCEVNRIIFAQKRESLVDRMQDLSVLSKKASNDVIEGANFIKRYSNGVRRVNDILCSKLQKRNCIDTKSFIECTYLLEIS